MRRFFIAFAVALTALLYVTAAPAAVGPLSYPLHTGQCGRQVRDLQWLLGGHRPSAYKITTFKHQPNGCFGARTKSAVVRMKWRLGWAPTALKPVADKPFILILEGKRSRPTSFITRAAARAKTMPAPVEPWAVRIVATERHELGVREVPLGSNDGRRVSFYQRATGAFRAPWCVSFQQAMRLLVGWHTIANSSAGVFYTVAWAKSRGIAFATPRVGDWVAFLDRLGHMGLVSRVVRGGFYSIEGNASDRVLERFHPTGERPEVFLRATPAVT